ncbi:sugar-binding transcriptional regulator [Fuchsiella alkaliacetigena]|uniref:sugar-binding transcriptional regulator n=1 Tax=Fuchsiella alkaliacetigena TaxID=957042 RepID=UPI00200B1EBD|nr:sugar-binding domain-containing protein [Fuchsiella alkaliacetigena]MCK8824845.1 sugar-binding transcriptional regulator [Fuchsiella alkaliacetigena]
MEDLIKLQHLIAPELIKLIDTRYTILQTVLYLQPIGRRSLAKKLELSEREVRKQLKFLQERRFVNSTRAGAEITARGEEIFSKLADYIKSSRGLHSLELELAKSLELKAAYVVPSTLDAQQTKEELGRFAAKFLQNNIDNGDKLAVTGGTTLAAVAEALLNNGDLAEIMVLPGRGGLGEGVEIQANTIAAKIAKKLGGKYRLLHVPDNLDQSLHDTIVSEPQIKEVLSLAKEADVLMHGIGTVEIMTERRDLNQDQLLQLQSKGAIGEAFGYYFDDSGEIVYSTPSVGLQLEDLKEIETVIAVAGGKEKAAAIISVIINGEQDILITEEEAAQQILDILDQH